jgi:hypothetical protein
VTRAEWIARLAARAADAERLGLTAPVGAILRDVLAEAEQVDGWPSSLPAPDTLIPLEQAAPRLGVSVRWLREQRPPYVVVLGDKTLRVSEQRLARWLAHHDNGGRRQLDHSGWSS